MVTWITNAGEQVRLTIEGILRRLGFKESPFLLVLAVLIALVTAVAAVGFHELIQYFAYTLYGRMSPDFLYGRGMYMLVVWPALGGLIVGCVGRYLVRGRAGHGVIDVMESVIRTSGFVRPITAFEKIFTAAVTIGSGGASGAEGPIVQIGAAIASGLGQLFRIARHHMPVLIGCGSAAGISAIFHAPIGGVLFTLEVILGDFSLRTFTPVVVASVLANVTTRAIFTHLGHGEAYTAIFAMPDGRGVQDGLAWGQVMNFIILGVTCGLAGVTLTRVMHAMEVRFAKLKRLGPFRPALGGAIVGVLGIGFVLIFGRVMLGWQKAFSFDQYPMPAFFGDGYGVIRTILTASFYTQGHVWHWLVLLAAMAILKILASSITLGSGGAGGVIAPSLFIGASVGGFFGLVLQQTTWFAETRPEYFALVGMGATLAAVVHAPLASILILVEITEDYRLTVPAMLASVTAVSMARLIHRESVYTEELRSRGLRSGAQDPYLMQRLTIEQVPLEPAAVVQASDPFRRVLELSEQLNAVNFVVIDVEGAYRGMVTADDVRTALLEPDAIPLLIASELMRTDMPVLRATDSLATAADMFARVETTHLPVTLLSNPSRVIGLLSRAALMRRYNA